MRQFLSILAGAAVLAPISVQAADSWSGAYVGLSAGGGWSSADWLNRASNPPATFFDYVPGQGFSDGLHGFIGGVQAGLNVQRGPWVFGVEAMLNGADIVGGFTSNAPLGAGDDQFKARMAALFTATARVGYAWDQWLAYAKGGYAAADIRVSVSDNVAPTTGSGKDSQWHSGAVAGIGIEYRIAPRVSLAAEYNHIWLDSGTYQLGGGAGNYSWDVDIGDINIVMVRLNYRFTDGL
jgi:outer membrane immunogenic protein